MVIEDLRESWADMFSHIDDLVEMIGNEYPEFSSFVNRDIRTSKNTIREESRRPIQ